LKQLAEKTGATIYLFGSYARGDHMLDSDVDVVVVSQGFESMSFPQRVEYVRRMLPEHLGFDVIPLTPRELKEKAKRSFYREISRYWIEIRPGSELDPARL
jgi:predicted nucleotidyltransferase